jgi:hypothetical protein
MKAITRQAALAAAVTAALVVACARKENNQARVDSAAGTLPPPAASAPAPVAFRVVSVDLGKSIGADKKVTAPSTTFAPRDTIYAVVSSEGTSPAATLAVHWLDQNGKVIAQDSAKITPTGPAATEFHLIKKSPFPQGKYKVEVLADGQSAGSMDFEIKK